MKFTDSQRSAIQHSSGHLQLIACAGSGKTEVVAQRVAWLLKGRWDEGLRPRNLLAFTFTDKAAAELKDRINARCQEALGEVNGMAEMFVGTIHAFCLDLLKTEVPRFARFEILNEVQRLLFIDRHSKTTGLTTSTDLKGQRLKRYVDTSLYARALDLLREASVDPQAIQSCSVHQGLQSYRGVLEHESYFDYTSILEEAVVVLSNEDELRERLRQRLQYVIVDEYQDLNPIQEAIVQILADLGATLCVVGDDDQTIYQWRGSDVENILTFDGRYAGVTPVRLQENFRSSEAVVEVARGFIAQNSRRLPKAMVSTDAQPSEAGDLVSRSFDTPDEEAAFLVATMKELRGVAFQEGSTQRGLAWSDMAVLLRTVKGSGDPILQALRQSGIPYIIVGMNNLFEQPEAEAARQLFYFIAARASKDELRQAWKNAIPDLEDSPLEQAIQRTESGRGGIYSGETRWNVYSLQRQFMGFLEDLGLREESVPDGRGEIIFYNLGMFSQLISDFETIHYRSKPSEKYDAFADFLKYRAEDAYPEGGQSNQYANPNAVRVMTVHQAKGLQWPVVFVPALMKNRFPGKKMGGRNVWHLVPEDAVGDAARYKGTVEDERRLFYVAITRSQKFLILTCAPVPNNQLYQKKSEFFEFTQQFKVVKRFPVSYASRPRLPSQARAGMANVVLTFSDLKYYFECPYHFKLRILYGFNMPLHEALGYGKSLHDALFEVHARVVNGKEVAEGDASELVATHLHTPYAYESLKLKLRDSAERVVRDYITDNEKEFENIEFYEKGISLDLGSGIQVAGRIDLVRKKDTGEVTIVDLKTREKSQAEPTTEAQLHIYALGYLALTGRNADLVEMYYLDERQRKRRSVQDEFIESVKAQVTGAAHSLRANQLPPAPSSKKCGGCDYRGLCGPGTACQS